MEIPPETLAVRSVQQPPIMPPVPSLTTPLVNPQMHATFGIVLLYPVYVPWFGAANGGNGDVIAHLLFEVGEGWSKRKKDNSDW